jgi:hypothetical protein
VVGPLLCECGTSPAWDPCAGLPLISIIVSSVGVQSLFFANAVAFFVVAGGFYLLLYSAACRS